MKNNFIPYEQAIEMKELGFNEDCFAYYRLNIWDVYFKPAKMELFLHHCYGDDHEHGVNAPLWQQAFKWFREKHDLQCWLHDGGMLGKCFIKIIGYKHDKFYFSSSEPMEYKEAELACLKKLIQIYKSEKCTNTKQP